MAKKGFICILILMLCLVCTGCATVGLQGKDAELIEANSRNIGRVEGTIGTLSDTIHDSRERLEIVGRASARIRDASERLDFLITEYEFEVERILDEIDRLRAGLEASQESKVDSNRTADSGERSSAHNIDYQEEN